MIGSAAGSEIVHVQLGRYGDELILLPCWWKIFQDTGRKPVVIVARDFADIFRGVSYVSPDPVNTHWYAGLSTVMQMARLKYPGSQITITQCHGHGHDTDQSKYPTFGHAMWSKAGFPGRINEFPLVFDRRNPEREQKLVRRVRLTNKPLLLYNFMGLSSPMRAGQVIRNVVRKFESRFEVVNLGQVRAERLYDLLGLYDIAAGMISIDTSTLHLARASKVPLLAFVRGGWSSAVPKAEAVVVEYQDVEKSLDKVESFVQGLSG